MALMVCLAWHWLVASCAVFCVLDIHLEETDGRVFYAQLGISDREEKDLL